MGNCCCCAEFSPEGTAPPPPRSAATGATKNQNAQRMIVPVVNQPATQALQPPQGSVFPLPIAAESRSKSQRRVLEIPERTVPNDAVEFLCSLLDSRPEELTRKMKTMRFVERDAWEYGVILQYINNSQAHSEFGIEVKSIIKITQSQVKEFRYRSGFSQSWNRMMLWHGTVLDNVRSILENGLEVPKVRNRRCLFGNGIYFADRISKSALYCTLVDCERTYGCVFLCDVNLGHCYPSLETLYDLVTPPTPFDSVQGIGKFVPGKRRKYFHGSLMPIGGTVLNKAYDLVPFKYRINYNEFVVYHPHDVNIRYLVYFKFTRKPFFNKTY